ncbi:MAG: pFP-BETA [Chlamydiia bacterium]|nr:pFP-BETA [Chlamydiia bacterium]
MDEKKDNQELSPLQKARLKYSPKIPQILQNISAVSFEIGDQSLSVDSFPQISLNPQLRLISQDLETLSKPLRVGVVLSGGQAAGGHNVLTGLFDAVQELHPESRLFGFLNGPSGIPKKKYIELTKEYLAPFRNQGGFDAIGSGRTKIETPDQFEEALKTCQELDLDGLLIIGGDDSNTNAAHLAEFFLERGCKTSVIGVPKTIDGDLQNENIEISFGFDTACKIYSETIGNIARDAISAKKYYYFIKLMGRSASHVTLECALNTHPNLALIAEEIQENKETLVDVASMIADLVVARNEQGKEYGVILIPEGVIEFLSDIKALIKELNLLLATSGVHSKNLEELHSFSKKIEYIVPLLSEAAKSCFMLLPSLLQGQFLIDRDPHGNVQVSKIETERLFIHVVEEELCKRRKRGEYHGSFSGQPIFCGYEGRACLPSNFDADYCYSLGRLSAALIRHQKTGYMAAITNLNKPAALWKAIGAPLHAMMGLESRNGKLKPVIKKALVNLTSGSFQQFTKLRELWRLQDHYAQPGPIQFFGPKEIVDSIPLSLQ